MGAFCIGATIPDLPTTSNNGITGSWSPAIIDNTQTTTYTFTPDAGQCAQEITLEIVVDASITPTFDAVGAFCIGATIPDLPTTSNNGITGSWSPAIDNMQTTTYTFTPDEGQCAEEITMEIEVNEKPTLTLFANRTEITCKEPTATITANASGGAIPYRYRLNNLWSVNNNFTIETGGVVDITMEDNNQCTANAQITISENKPSPIVTVKTIPAVCYPATIDLANAIVTSNASINKYFSTSNLSSELSSTIVQGVTNKTFYVAGFDMQTGCMGNATAIPVQINELNVQHIGDTIVCENNTVRLWARGMGEQATQYKYDFYRTGNNPSYAVANNTQNRYIESITTTNGNILYNIGVQNGACQYNKTFTISTINSPVLKVEESSKGVKAIVENEIHPPYLYRFDDGFWQASPWFHLHEKGTYDVTVANAHGCETTIPFTINSSLDIIPALFFTPNGDGVNDTWEIENIGHYPHAIIEIYDRFSKHLITYKGNETGWDGMYLGYPMPMTDYWYIITIPELGKPRTGHFTLKR